LYGERLPTAKDLAVVMNVNGNTVIRALHILKQEGLVDFKRGRGVHVVGTAKESAVYKYFDELIRFASIQGFSHGQVVELVRRRISLGENEGA
jgi:GntR family transcriptional regulator